VGNSDQSSIIEIQMSSQALHIASLLTTDKTGKVVSQLTWTVTPDIARAMTALAQSSPVPRQNQGVKKDASQVTPPAPAMPELSPASFEEALANISVSKGKLLYCNAPFRLFNGTWCGPAQKAVQYKTMLKTIAARNDLLSNAIRAYIVANPQTAAESKGDGNGTLTVTVHTPAPVLTPAAAPVAIPALPAACTQPVALPATSSAPPILPEVTPANIIPAVGKVPAFTIQPAPLTPLPEYFDELVKIDVGQGLTAYRSGREYLTPSGDLAATGPFGAWPSAA
jgi:hypothetical protein